MGGEERERERKKNITGEPRSTFVSGVVEQCLHNITRIYLLDPLLRTGSIFRLNMNQTIS